VLVDDSTPLLHALAELLRAEGVAVAGAVQTGTDALRYLQRRPATTLVLDVRLPDLGGLEVARRAAEIQRSKTSVIFYTSEADAAFVQQALDGGAQAVVLKDAPPENLLDAIAAVAAGQIYIDPRLRRRAKSVR
jgi:DNA-binding NarL/FixJ family response regulator